MKVAILNDTHCGVRNSSEIMIDYQEKFYRDVFFPYLRENGIKKILHLGDYYENRKFINFKALNANRKHFLEVLRKENIHMDIIPGNHDTYFKDTNELNSLKELLGHYMEEVRIIEKPTVVDYDGCAFGLLPWINQGNEKETAKFLKSCKADYIGAHLELTGFEWQKGVPCTDGMSSELFNRFEGVFTGHFHTKSSSGNIFYMGSQFEFFWSDAHDPKYFHVFDTETRELDAIQNPITIYERIYYNDTVEKNHFKYSQGKLPEVDHKFVKLVVVNKSDPKLFERFCDRIQSRPIHELKIEENFNEFLGASVDDDDVTFDTTEDLLYNYIDAVETSLDKGKIKEKMSGLLVEAQNMEIV